MKKMIVISAVGRDRTGVVHQVTKAISECGGNIVESRMTALGNEFAMLVLVSGNWHALNKLEQELPQVGNELDLKIHVHKTEAQTPREDRLPYAVDAVCLDQTGIVSELARFFASHDIEIAELNTNSYAAAHTGAPMFSVQMTVNIPGTIHISTLREEFMEFCDQLNLDAIIEPVKN